MSWPPTSQTVKLMFLYLIALASRTTTRRNSPAAPPARANSLNGLNVEADGGNSGDLAHKSAAAAEASRSSGQATYNFTELQLVQDGGLAGSIEPNHQNTHFLFGKKTLEQALEGSHLEESGSSGCFLSRAEMSRAERCLLRIRRQRRTVVLYSVL